MGGFSSERLPRFDAPGDGLAFLNWDIVFNRDTLGNNAVDVDEMLVRNKQPVLVNILVNYLLWGSPHVDTCRSPEQRGTLLLAWLCFFLLQNWQWGQSGSWGWGLPVLVTATSPQLQNYKNVNRARKTTALNSKT